MNYFLADPHFGHQGIDRFRPHVTSCADNEAQIMNELCKRLNKRSILWVLGDAAFTKESLQLFAELPCKKILVKGNHDGLPLLDYVDVFDELEAMVKYKGFWITHAPIHADELRGKPNLHGHVHGATIMRRAGVFVRQDRRYLNACPEYVYPRYGKFLLTLDEVRSYFWGSGA